MGHAPIIFDTAGDTYLASATIASILWEAESTSGDLVELHFLPSHDILWLGRTDRTQTYLGLTIGPEGILAPGGFTCARIDSGRVLVYLKESF